MAERYRKKPVVIEALQYTDMQSLREIEAWSHGAVTYSDNDGIHIDTLEGRLYVDDGDWVIRDIKGAFCPCKPDIFEATYEPAGGSGG